MGSVDVRQLSQEQQNSVAKKFPQLFDFQKYPELHQYLRQPIEPDKTLSANMVETCDCSPPKLR